MWIWRLVNIAKGQECYPGIGIGGGNDTEFLPCPLYYIALIVVMVLWFLISLTFGTVAWAVVTGREGILPFDPKDVVSLL